MQFLLKRLKYETMNRESWQMSLTACDLNVSFGALRRFIIVRVRDGDGGCDSFDRSEEKEGGDDDGGGEGFVFFLSMLDMMV